MEQNNDHGGPENYRSRLIAPKEEETICPNVYIQDEPKQVARGMSVGGNEPPCEEVNVTKYYCNLTKELCVGDPTDSRLEGCLSVTLINRCPSNSNRK